MNDIYALLKKVESHIRLYTDDDLRQMSTELFNAALSAFDIPEAFGHVIGELAHCWHNCKLRESIGFINQGESDRNNQIELDQYKTMLTFFLDLLSSSDETMTFDISDRDAGFLRVFEEEVLHYTFFIPNDETSPKQDASRQPQHAYIAKKQPVTFSDNQNTNGAIWGLLKRLENGGWITPTEYGFKWRKGVPKQLIAYWVYKVSHNFKLSDKQAANRKYTTNWRPFERLFGLKFGTLSNAKCNWVSFKSEFQPVGFEDIEPYTK